MKKETLKKIIEIMMQDGYLLLNIDDKTNNIPSNSGKDIVSTGTISINYIDSEK